MIFVGSPFYQTVEGWEKITDISVQSSCGYPAAELLEHANYQPIDAEIIRYACNKSVTLLSLIDQVMYQGVVRELVIGDRSKLFYLQEPFLRDFPDFFEEQLALVGPDLDRVTNNAVSHSSPQVVTNRNTPSLSLQQSPQIRPSVSNDNNNTNILEQLLLTTTVTRTLKMSSSWWSLVKDSTRASERVACNGWWTRSRVCVLYNSGEEPFCFATSSNQIPIPISPIYPTSSNWPFPRVVPGIPCVKN